MLVLLKTLSLLMVEKEVSSNLVSVLSYTLILGCLPILKIPFTTFGENVSMQKGNFNVNSVTRGSAALMNIVKPI